ncbi:MAG: hypothetical protein AB7F65_11485 [Dehalococcoidia bacterium]
MIQRAGAYLLPAALIAALFVTAALIGYVYSHEPARDTLLVEFEGTPVPQPTYVIGSVAAVDGDTLRLSTGAGGSRELRLPAGAPVEELRRLAAPPTDGTSVNVGVDETAFGQVLTGIVAFEAAP